MTDAHLAQDAPRIDSGETVGTLARIRGKLVRRLYSPGAEQDITDLLELLTAALVTAESAEQDNDWVRIRPASAWTRLARAVNVYDGLPLTIAEKVETLVSDLLAAQERGAELELALDRERCNVLDLEALIFRCEWDSQARCNWCHGRQKHSDGCPWGLVADRHRSRT